MAVGVGLMTLEEIPYCAELYMQGFGKDKHYLAAFPPALTPGFRAWWVTEDLDDFHNNAAARYVKAVIDDKIVAYAKWNVPTMNSEGKLERGGDNPDDMPLYPAGTNQVIALNFMGTMARKRREIMGEQPHCYLEEVATLPAYQGRGAATKLVQWGLTIADEMGLDAYLEGNVENLAWYRRFGFEVVEDYQFKEPEYLESFMLRPRKQRGEKNL